MVPTRILALETSGTSGSVAALAGETLLAHSALDPELRSARSLAPAIRDLLAQVGWRPADVELVAVTVGPGSFTGLRVGVATGKTFAYAVGAKVLGLNTLEVIAAQAPRDLAGDMLAAALDAHRGEVFAALFRRKDDGSLDWLSQTAVVNRDEWLASLPAPCQVTGPILEQLADRVPAGRACVPSDFWYPTAATVGALTATKYAAGGGEDPIGLVPLYVRRSAAEEKAGGW
jgi:tRNA threonylcarbamoyladenosine biosynthesis protein TsaB